MHAVTYIKGSVTMRAENIKSGNLLKALRAENGMLKILFAIGVLCAEHMWAGSRQSQDNLLLSQSAWAAGHEQRYFIASLFANYLSLVITFLLNEICYGR
jgi:hypothetical protein